MANPFTTLWNWVRSGSSTCWDPAWTRKRKGRWGEGAAERFLWKDRGHRILARNVSFKEGEIDLVTEDRGTIVFVEVKTRFEPDRNPPLPAVDEEKMGRLVRASRRYLRTIRPPRPPARIDLVGVVPDPETGAPRISHLPGAVQLSDRNF
jgi:putative endonuclease